MHLKLIFKKHLSDAITAVIYQLSLYIYVSVCVYVRNHDFLYWINLWISSSHNKCLNL